MTRSRTTWAPAGRCSLVAVDVVGFGGRRKNVQVQMFLRDRLYTLIRDAIEKSGVEFDRCYFEDRGDGLVIAVPPEVETERLVHPFVEYVRAGLRLHNLLSSDLAQIRLRLALHAGEAWTDSYGLVGDSVIHLFRLLEAPAFKQFVAGSGAYLALLASDHVHDAIIRHAPGLIDPDDYLEVPVQHKETTGVGWVRLVGRSVSVDRSA